MTPSELQRRFEELPQAVQDYLYSDEIGDLNGRIIEKNAVPKEKLGVLFMLIREAIVGAVPVDLLDKETAKRFGFDESAARKLAADIAGYRLLPLDKFLGNVSSAVRRFGEDPAAYPEFRLKVERRTPEQAAEEVVHAADMPASSAAVRLRERMQSVVQSFLAGVRTENQAREILTRSEKVGGMGLDDQAAGRLMEEMKEEARSVTVAPEPAAPPAPPAPPQPAPVPPPKEDFRTIRQEDEQEIERLKQKNAIPSASEETDRRIRASVDELYAASGLATEDEGLRARIKTVIESRLRDVRDAMETLETMVQPKTFGGLGLPQEAARDLLARIEDKLKRVHEEHAAKAKIGKRQWADRERLERSEAEAQAARSSVDELERLFATVVAKGTPPAVPASVSAPLAPAEPPLNLPIASSSPIPTAARAPVPPAFVPPPPATAPRPAMAPKPPITIVRPDAPPAAPEGRKKIEDVRPPPSRPESALTGPVEELRSTTLADFRRMAKTADEAAARIREKVRLLSEQSFTKRAQGIAGWSESEVHRMYLDMVREALAGTPLPQVIAARQAAKRPVLTPEEFRALGALNRELRY